MFRFTIRELVLLTVIVAMNVAWWLDTRAWVKKSQRDGDLWQKQWADREKEWVEANRWWNDAKDAWRRQRASHGT